MKLIIDVPEKIYNCISDTRIAKCMVYGGSGCFKSMLVTLLNSIYNGTPLDTLRTEIEEIKTDTMYKYVGDFRYGVDTIIEIIDKYKAESENKRCR